MRGAYGGSGREGGQDDVAMTLSAGISAETFYLFIFRRGKSGVGAGQDETFSLSTIRFPRHSESYTVSGTPTAAAAYRPTHVFTVTHTPAHYFFAFTSKETKEDTGTQNEIPEAHERNTGEGRRPQR